MRESSVTSRQSQVARRRSLVAKRWLLVCAGGVVAAAALLQAQTTDGIPARSPARFLSVRFADSLERPQRDDQEHPDDLFRAMGLKAGDVVADVGCGTGFLARRIAKIVGPTGKVYCEDIPADMLEQMKQRAAREGVIGIVPVLGTADDPRLPPGTSDWLLLADVYHEMDDGPGMLAHMRAALAPRGRIAIVEARAEDNTASYINPAHRMSVRQVLAEWKPAGYRLVDLLEGLPSHHLFIMETGDAAGRAPAIADMSLATAMRTAAVEAQPHGSGDRTVTVRIRRTGKDRLIVTTAPGEYFASPLGRTRDMVTTRDGWTALFDDNWHDMTLSAGGVALARDAPGLSVSLELRPERSAPLRTLMYAMQAGGLPSIVAQASLAIAVDDRTYDEMEPLLGGGPVSAAHAAALAMIAVERISGGVSSRRIMAARDRLAEAVPDEMLRLALLQLRR